MLAPSEEIRTALNLKKITPSTVQLKPRPRALYISVDGTISIENGDGSTESNIVVIAGSTIPCQIAKITSATGAVVYGYYN